MLKRQLGDISKSGAEHEMEYWRNKAGGDSSHDCMMNFLATQGFSGHPRDAYRAWIASVGAVSGGTEYDNSKNYYDGTASP